MAAFARCATTRGDRGRCRLRELDRSTTGRTGAGAGSGVTAFGRTVMTGVPRRTRLSVSHVPANTDWVATGPPASARTCTASVMIPASSRTATRAATSLPLGPEVIRTATGAVRPASSTSARASTTGRYAGGSGGVIAYTVVAPYRPSASIRASPASPWTTAAGSPSRRASVSSSRLGFRMTPSSWWTRTRTVLTAASEGLVDLQKLVGGEEIGQLCGGVALVGDDRAGLPGRPGPDRPHLRGRATGADPIGRRSPGPPATRW